MTIKQIAVLGMPNTGKSTFFNRFTGANASIGNCPLFINCCRPQK